MIVLCMSSSYFLDRIVYKLYKYYITNIINIKTELLLCYVLL